MDKSNLEKLVVEERNEELKAMLQNSEPSELVDDSEMTLLHLAAKHNNLELIRYLLSLGFNINARNFEGNTPLAIALFSDRFEAMKILLQSDADIFGVNNVGTSTIEILMRKMEELPADVVICIAENYKRNNLDHETKAEIVAKARLATLRFVVVLPGVNLATAMFLKRNDDVGLHNLSVAVKFAFERQDDESARIILKMMPHHKIQHLFYDQYDRFFRAEQNDDVKFAELFLNRALEWNIMDKHIIIQKFEDELAQANEKVVKKFLHANFDGYIRTEFGIEILGSLFGNPNVDAIELVRNRTFIVNGIDASGCPVLHHAIRRYSEKNVRFLLDIGANPNVKDRIGRTPLDLCAFRDLTTCGELLLQYGADFQLSLVANRGISTKRGTKGLVFVAFAQLAIDDARGIPIGRPLCNKITFTYGSRFEKCLKQIEEFKTHEILDSVTLFTVLTAKSENLARRLRGEDCFSKLEDYCQTREIHSYYDSTLKFKLDRALKINLAKSNFAKIVSQKAGIMICFDHLVIDRVFSFLTYYDLLQLI